jgi:hypothetical protein
MVQINADCTLWEWHQPGQPWSAHFARYQAEALASILTRLKAGKSLFTEKEAVKGFTSTGRITQLFKKRSWEKVLNLNGKPKGKSNTYSILPELLRAGLAWEGHWVRTPDGEYKDWVTNLA